MRTSPILALLALSFVGACALPTEEGEVITLENAAHKEDGREHVTVPLSSERLGATVYFTCDETALDRCEIALNIYTDLATEGYGQRYLESLDFESHLDLAAIRVYQPDGERAEVLLREEGTESARDVVRMRSRWEEFVDPNAPSWLTSHLEGAFELHGQFRVRSWQKGEYRIELDHLPLPEYMPDARTMYVSAYWE